MGDVWRGFFKFHGTHITENLSWTTNTHHMVKNARQQLHFLRTLRILRKKHLDEKMLVSYCCTNESVLAYCISTWYGRLKIINTTQKITGCALPPLQDIISFRCPTRSANILKDPFMSIKSRTNFCCLCIAGHCIVLYCFILFLQYLFYKALRGLPSNYIFSASWKGREKGKLVQTNASCSGKPLQAPTRKGVGSCHVFLLFVWPSL